MMVVLNRHDQSCLWNIGIDFGHCFGKLLCKLVLYGGLPFLVDLLPTFQLSRLNILESDLFDTKILNLRYIPLA